MDINGDITLGAVDVVIEDVFTADGSITLAGGTLAFQEAGTFDGAVNQVADAGTGSLIAEGTLEKTGAGDLTLAGDTLVDLNDDVTVDNGRLLLPDGANAAGDLEASGDLTLDNAVVLDGAGAQRVDSTAGGLTVNAVNKDTGDLVLGGASSIDINATIDLNDGSLTIEDAFTAAGHLLASQDVSLKGAGTFDGVANQTVDAEGGTLTAEDLLLKTTAGALVLAGDTAIDLNANVGASVGGVTIEDAFTAAGNVVALQNVTLNGEGTFDGAADQVVASFGGALTANDDLTKTTAGDLTLAGGVLVDLNGNVNVDQGSLVLPNATQAAGDLVARDDITMSAQVTLDGTGTQRVDSTTGTLTVNNALTKATGDLFLGGDTAVDINALVDLNGGSLTIEDAFTANNNLVASQDVDLLGAGTLDGAVSQRIDAEGGTLTAAQTLTKTGAGNLNLGGAAAIDLNDTVDVDAGSLILEEAFAAAGNLVASQDVMLNGQGTLDGAGNQLVDAEAGTLTANADLTKTTSGDLELRAGTLVDLNADVNVNQGGLNLPGATQAAGDLVARDDLTLGSTVTFDGIGTQRVDSTMGTLTVNDTLTKAVGDLVLAGETAIDINALVDLDGGSLTIEDPFTANNNLVASQNVTLRGAGTLDGPAGQRIDAESGTLTADGTLTKSTAGDLALAGGTAIDLNDEVTVDAGSLVVEDAFSAAGDLAAGQDVTLQGVGTLDGVAAQRLDAQAGTLTVNAALTKTGAGTLVLGGGAAIDLNALVDVDAGSLEVEDAFTSDNSLRASQDVTLQAAGVLDGAGEQRVDAEGGTLTANGQLTKAVGDLVLGGGALVDLNALVDVDGGSLTVEDPFQANNNLIASQDVTLQGAGTLDAAGAQRIDAEAGTLRAEAGLDKASGDLNLGGGTLIDLNGSVDLAGGSLLVEDVFTAEGDLVASQDVTLPVAGTLDGGNDQRLDAEGGTLLVQATLTKSAAGNLVLGGGTAIDLNALVDNDAGGLTIEDAFTSDNNLEASGDITLEEQGTMDAPGAQTIAAQTGTLLVEGSLQKAAGDLNLAGGAGIDLDAPVNVPAGNLDLASANGSVRQLSGTVTSPTMRFNAGADVDLTQSGNDWDVIAGIAAGQVNIIDANALTIGSANGIDGILSSGGGISLAAAGGDLTIVQAVNGNGEVCLKATDDVLLMAHVTAGDDVGIWADSDADQMGNVVQSAGTVEALAGDLFASGFEVTQTGPSELRATQGTIVINADSNSVVNLGSTLTGLTGKRIVIGAGSILVGTELAAEETAILRSWTGSIQHGPGAPQSAKVKAFSVGLLGETGLGTPGEFLRVDSDFLVTGTASGGADVYIEEVGATTAQRGTLFLTEYPSTGPDCMPGIPRPYETLADIFNDFGELVSSEDDLNLIAEEIIGGSLIAGNNANVIVTGSVRLDEFIVPGTANVRVGGDFNVDEFDVGTLDLLQVGGNALVGVFTVENTARIDIRGGYQGGILDVGGNADVDVGGTMSLNTMNVGGSADVNSGGMDVSDINVGGSLRVNTGNLRFDQMRAGRVDVNAGSIEMGRVDTGSARFEARGAIRDNNSEVTASSLTMSGSTIGTEGSPIVLNASRIDSVSGRGDVFIRQIKSGDTPIGLLSAGGKLVVDVPSGGLSDANGDALNIQSAGLSRFNAQYLGTSQDALEVNIGDALYLDGAGLSGITPELKARIFANLFGTIEGSDGRRIFYIGDVPIPGFVLLNGQILLGDQQLLAEVFRSEAFIVETPEIKSPEGVFGGPYFIHVYMQISEAWNLFLDVHPLRAGAGYRRSGVASRGKTYY